MWNSQGKCIPTKDYSVKKGNYGGTLERQSCIFLAAERGNKQVRRRRRGGDGPRRM